MPFLWKGEKGTIFGENKKKRLLGTESVLLLFGLGNISSGLQQE